VVRFVYFHLKEYIASRASADDSLQELDFKERGSLPSSYNRAYAVEDSAGCKGTRMGDTRCTREIGANVYH
jgi:hypothetical protein